MISNRTNVRCFITQRRLTVCAASLFIMLVSSAVLAQGTQAPTQYTVPMEAFMKDFMKASGPDHFTLSGNLIVPTIWLYSPTGKLMAVADSDASLANLTRTFPPAKTTAPANQASLKNLFDVLAMSSGKSAHPAPTMPDRKWTAVLFTVNSPQCHHCAEFERTMQKFGGEHADALNDVTVTLKMP